MQISKLSRCNVANYLLSKLKMDFFFIFQCFFIINRMKDY